MEQSSKDYEDNIRRENDCIVRTVKDDISRSSKQSKSLQKYDPFLVTLLQALKSFKQE
jgi:hypothetical protein